MTPTSSAAFLVFLLDGRPQLNRRSLYLVDAVGGLGFFISVAIYQRYLKHVALRKLFFYSTYNPQKSLY